MDAMRFHRLAPTVALGCVLLGLLAGPAARAQNPTVRFSTNLGDIDVRLRPDAAPATVANFLGYVDRGDYNNSFLHRSVPGFVLQGGGFRFVNDQVDTIQTQPPVVNEFNVSNQRGTIAMAKIGNDPNSATDQWFFNLADNSGNLDGQNGGFTVFGQVTNDRGQAVVDAIAAQPTVNAGSPFDQLPVVNYSGSGNITGNNLVKLNSVTRLEVSAVSTFSVVGTPNRGGFVLSRTGDLSVLTVVYHNGGSASRGVDYVTFPGTLTFDIGQSEALIPVTLLPGANRNRKVKVFLDPAADGSYTIGKAQTKVFLSDLP